METKEELDRVFGKVRVWAEGKELFKHSSVKKQLGKLNEETDELKEAIYHFTSFLNNKSELEKEFGDVVVVLTILAAQLDLRLEDCIKAAYNKIKNRTGKTVNGVFVKDEDKAVE
jgi:NTP pyrophosphatase (non-canonical NTP hydrolase)